MTSPGRRRSPHFARFIVTGGVVGFLVGLVVGAVGAEAPRYSTSTQLGYLGVLGAGVGGLVAGLVAVLLDRRR